MAGTPPTALVQPEDGHLTSETLSWDSESPAEARNGARLACLHSACASKNWIPGADPIRLHWVPSSLRMAGDDTFGFNNGTLVWAVHKGFEAEEENDWQADSQAELCQGLALEVCRVLCDHDPILTARLGRPAKHGVYSKGVG